MAKPLSRPYRIAVRILAASPGFSANLRASLGGDFSCSILGNRASIAAEQRGSPAREIPGFYVWATHVSGDIANPTSGIMLVIARQPIALGELSKVIRMGIQVAHVLQ